MKISPAMAGALLIALTQVVPAAALTARQRSEQQELLAWARTLRYQARVEQAMSVCEMILSADPGCVEALVESGVLALSESHYEAALKHFNDALKERPHDPAALVGRAHVHQAQGDFRKAQKDAMETRQKCDELLSADSADAHTYYLLGLAKLLLKDDSALQDFVTAVSHDASHVDAHTERAFIYLRRGQIQHAIDQMTRAVEVRPDYAVGYLVRARFRYKAGDITEAMDDCTRALEVNPRFARAWHNRGLLQIERRNFDKAVHDLTEALAADPDYASAHVYRGQAYLATGNSAAARADWERTRELSPDDWAGEVAREMLQKLQATASTEG